MTLAKRIKKGLVVGLVTMMVMGATTGCVSMKSKYVEIKPNETAILIPYEGDTTKQQSLKSEEFYKKNLVGGKRVEITYSKKKTGLGTWKTLPDHNLMIVDRTPISREWTSATNTGTLSKNQGFIVESSESIGFVVPLTCTAQIDEENVPLFLSKYPSKNLESVMDVEVRNYVSSELVEEMSKHTVEVARKNKSEVMEVTRTSTEDYFKERGITITNLGFAGQYEYLDKEIQTSINDVFNAEKKRQKAEIDKKTAKEEAEALEIRKATMNEQIKLKEKDNEALWIKKWNGVLPNVMSGDGGMILQMPTQKK